MCSVKSIPLHYIIIYGNILMDFPLNIFKNMEVYPKSSTLKLSERDTGRSRMGVKWQSRMKQTCASMNTSESPPPKMTWSKNNSCSWRQMVWNRKINYVRPNHWQIKEEADIKKSYQWLATVSLTDSTEALIMAAEEQALMARSTVAGVYDSQQAPSCRLCEGAPPRISNT